MSNSEQFEKEATYEIARLIAANLHAQDLLTTSELAALQRQLQGHEKPLVGRLDDGPMDWINPAE